MSRLNSVDPSKTSGKAKELLDGVNAKLGVVPNMTKVMVNSPAVLEAYLGFSGALAGGHLNPKLREKIALFSAQENQCNYCLSAHTAIGKMVGLPHEQIVASRKGEGSTGQETAALTFVKHLLDTKGHATEAEIEALKAARFSDGDIAEIIAHVALNVFTNYFNVASAVDIDFPKVSYQDMA
jgi:uncharacterized peroxidase-related enzyme